MKKTKKKTTKKPTVGTAIKDVTCIGVQWDATAVGAVQTIADGLVENARALGKLAEVLKSSHVKIDSMIRVDG